MSLASLRALAQESGVVHIDPLAAKRDALGDQVTTLARALGQRAVGADHAPPGQVGIVDLEEHRTGKARRTRRDVAVGTDEAGRNLTHAGEHFERARFG